MVLFIFFYQKLNPVFDSLIHQMYSFLLLRICYIFSCAVAKILIYRYYKMFLIYVLDKKNFVDLWKKYKNINVLLYFYNTAHWVCNFDTFFFIYVKSEIVRSSRSQLGTVLALIKYDLINRGWS